jgi:hypothetical protein
LVEVADSGSGCTVLTTRDRRICKCREHGHDFSIFGIALYVVSFIAGFGHELQRMELNSGMDNRSGSMIRGFLVS